MSKVYQSYQSVRGVLKGTLHRKKPHIVGSAWAKGNDDSLSLNGVIDELEKIFVDGIGRLKAAASDDRAVVASEAEQAEQVIEGLRANVTELENKLKETEDTVHNKEVASQKVEESLSTQIRDLQSEITKKEEALESRESEVNDLKSKIDALTEQVSQSELAIQQAKGEAAREAEQAEQVIEGLKANVTELEKKLKETENTVHNKEVASQKVEESLSTQIRDLQSEITKKEEALESRESEVNDLKSKIDALTEQVSQSELTIQQAKGEAAREAQRAEQIPEGLKIKIAMLQAQLRQTEQIVGRTDSTVAGLDQHRDGHAINLDAQLGPRANGIKDSKAEALVDIHAHAIRPGIPREQLKTGEEKPTTFLAARVAPVVTEAARQTVSQDAFDRMIAEFSKLTNVMESIASLIVRDHVRAFGESMEEFPQKRLTRLLESLSKEISDVKLKADFCERFSKV